MLKEHTVQLLRIRCMAPSKQQLASAQEEHTQLDGCHSNGQGRLSLSIGTALVHSCIIASGCLPVAVQSAMLSRLGAPVTFSVSAAVPAPQQ
jgi:hypothetical protein